MAGLTFRLADERDDEAIRVVLRSTPMPGNVSLAFQREPCFATGERAGNLESQTMLCCDRETGAVVGLGTRSIRRAYVGGRAVEIGYLSMLRGVPQARG